MGMFYFGIALVAFGVTYICMGKAYARFHGWVSRGDDPKGFWTEVALYLVVGVGFITYWLYSQ